MSKLRIKTSIILCITTFAFMHNALADTANSSTSGNGETSGKSEGYLKEIRDILLANINKLPVYLNQLTKMALSWLAPDNSESTAIQQRHFSTLANAKLENTKTQLADQNKMLTDFFSQLTFSPGQMPLKNAISYQTLLYQPPFQSKTTQPPSLAYNPDAAYYYIQNAAALNIRHKTPPTGQTSTDPNYNMALQQYHNYFMTTSAVQTYNGYLLSELYADFKNQNKAKQAQDELIQKASQRNWFLQIASENLGLVLRQILMYNSQTYVVLAELLETQKKLLAATAMNNALLIAVNQDTEKRLYQRANQEPITP